MGCWTFLAAFLLHALTVRVIAVRDTVVVTQFSLPEQEERAVVFFQALQATNPRSSLSARYRRDVERESEQVQTNPFLSADHRIYIHACVSLSNASSSSTVSLETARERFLRYGVEIHALHSLANRGGARDDLYWRQLTCASQVGDFFFERNALEVDVLFVDIHLLPVGDLRTTFLQQAGDFELLREQQRTLRRERRGKRESEDRVALFPRSELPRVFCLPRAMPRSSRYESAHSHSLCELDLWLLPSSVGTDWYAAVNASLSLSAELLDAHSAFSQAVLSVTSGVEFFDAADYVVRAGRHWVQNIRTTQSADTQEQFVPTLRDRVSLIEFDDSEQVLSLSREQCQIKLFVKWEENLHSATVILRVLQSLSLHEDDERMNELVGCRDISFAEQYPSHSQGENSQFNTSLLFFPFSLFADRFATPRILDVVMLNDELSLLALRMHQLRNGAVDAHVVIEAPQTFTGREKPLYFEHALSVLREMQESLQGDNETERRGDQLHDNMHLQANSTHIHTRKSSPALSPLNPYIHVVLSQLHTAHIDRREQVWLNEFYSRNRGTAAALAALGARETDVLLLLDIDEIPHVRTLQTLRSLYSFDRETLHVKTLLPRNHRLNSLQFRYSFQSTRSLFRDELLSGGAGVAVPLFIARSLRENLKYNTELSPEQSMHKDIYLALNDDESNFVTIARTHLQSAGQPYSWRDVLWPGGWHLSFFGGSERVRNKLRSYSHQNFAVHFTQSRKKNSSSGESSARKHTTTTINSINNHEENENNFAEVVVEDVSTQKIEEKISRGEEIDPRRTVSCLSLTDDDLDAETRSLQSRFIRLEERFQQTHEKIEKKEKSRNLRVAFVTGHIGAGLTLLPPLPSAHHDCFFITNNAAFAEQARMRGWRDILITDIELVQSDTGVVAFHGVESDELLSGEVKTAAAENIPSVEDDETERLIFNSVQAKWFKVFPQYFLSPLFPSVFEGKLRYLELAVREITGKEDARAGDERKDERELVSLAKAVLAMNSSHSAKEQYDFIVSFDNKYTLRVDEVFDALIKLENEKHINRDTVQDGEHMRSSTESADMTAMMLHRRPECCGADLEFKASLYQPRYRRFRPQMETYISEQVALGFPVHGERHFQTGFIIYNLHHDLVVSIQSSWWEHVQRAGIQCQIAFYFIAQRFPRAVQEFTADWNYGRMFIYIKNIVDSSGLSKEEVLRGAQNVNALVDISNGQRLSLKF